MLPWYSDIANGTDLQIEEVKGVIQVLDQEEEIAMQEFAKFEAKLKEQKGPSAIAEGNSRHRGTLRSTTE